MPKVIRSFVETDFGQMHIRMARPEKSSRKPLVCLHMTPQSGRDFEDFMREASRDRLVIAPDYHGYGESDVPPASPEVMISDYAHTVWQSLDSLDVKEIDVLGHHTGSKVAIEMARQNFECVSSLTLVSIALASAKVQDSKPKVFTPIALDEDGQGLTNWWGILREFYGSDVSLDVLSQQFAESLRAGQNFHWGFRAASNYNSELVSIVSALEVPITVICPCDDLVNITPQLCPT